MHFLMKKYLVYCLMAFFLTALVVHIIQRVTSRNLLTPSFGILGPRSLTSRKSMATSQNESLSSHLIQVGILPRGTRQGNRSGNSIANSLFLTMIDGSYIPAVRVFHAVLQKYRLAEHLIVICLDEPCITLGKFYNLFIWEAFVNASVAKVKFEIDLDLTQAGFDFILFDCDVYLTQYHHPLAFMTNFSDLSWNIQFQADRNDLKGLVNIGWFWSRPSPETLEYYRLSRQRWLSRGGWDQAVMNDVLSEIEKNRSNLRAIRLDPRRYVNYMLTDWYFALSPRRDGSKNLYDLSADIRYEMIVNASKQSVMWHYTCVEKPLKSFLAKYYGQWIDLDGYYTKQRSFLSPINLGYGGSGTETLLAQFRMAIEIAAISGRTLIFPDVVYVNGKDRLPGVRAFSIKELDAINISYVEPTYLYNRQVKHKIDRPIPHVRGVVVETIDTLIDDVQSRLRTTELLVLDFALWNTTTTFFSTASNRKTTMNLNQLRLCHNIASRADCLRICT